MTTLAVGVRVPSPAGAPPGVDPAAWVAALLGDTFDVVDDLAGVSAVVLAVDDAEAERAARATYATTSVLVAGPGVVEGFDVLAQLPLTIAALLAGDVPDLPGLLVAKLLGGCEDHVAAVCPSPDGSLAGLALQLPVPAWFRAAPVGLDDDAALDLLHAVAPAKSVVIGPGWRRLRRPTDVAGLDPALGGWPRTRALLSAQSSPR